MLTQTHGDGDFTGVSNDNRRFHEVAIFIGLWILVLFIALHALSTLSFLLQPLLWAFFLSMGLQPCVDTLERLFTCGHKGHVEHLRTKDSSEETPSDEALEQGTSSSAEGGGRRCGGSKSGCARTCAVAITLTIFLGLMTGFLLMIYKSALHMQHNWSFYQAGADRFQAQLDSWKSLVPADVLKSTSRHSLEKIENFVSEILKDVAELLTDTLVQAVMAFLYLLFWLCTPIHVGEDVAIVFRKYIVLKTGVSALYAMCVWILLHVLGVDLAIVFGFVTFVFNFIPEIGPFLAMMMPLPVIIFDSRIEEPLVVFLAALGGQLGLKFIFGNIVEVKLIESRETMRMHPVVILFSVALFGWMWGATGMLLSVPVIAAAKATVHAIPKIYRDPILVFLEGDLQSPARWEAWRMRTLSSKALEKQT